MLPSVRSVRRTLFSAAAIAAIATLPAQAQFSSNNGTKGFAITGVVGGYFASNLFNVTATGANLNFSDSWTYGGRLLYTPHPHIGVELGYMYASSNITYGGAPVIGAPSTNLGSVGFNQIDLNGLFGGGNGKLYGYFTLGLGMTIIDPKPNPEIGNLNSASSTKFAWNLGGGGFFMFNPKVGFRVDGRFRTIDTGRTVNSGTACGFWGCWTYASTWYNSGELTGGLTFRF
jgi:hypothetical protein